MSHNTETNQKSKVLPTTSRSVLRYCLTITSSVRGDLRTDYDHGISKRKQVPIKASGGDGATGPTARKPRLSLDWILDTTDNTQPSKPKPGARSRKRTCGCNSRSLKMQPVEPRCSTRQRLLDALSVLTVFQV
jgi:hypothetical protein